AAGQDVGGRTCFGADDDSVETIDSIAMSRDKAVENFAKPGEGRDIDVEPVEPAILFGKREGFENRLGRAGDRAVGLDEEDALAECVARDLRKSVGGGLGGLIVDPAGGKMLP